MDAEQWHYSVSDPSDRYPPIYHPPGGRRNLPAEAKKGKARGDPCWDLGRQTPEAGGVAEPPTSGHRHNRLVLYHPCGRLQGGVPSACGESTPVHSRRLFHRYRGRDHRLQPRHGAVPHSAKAHRCRPHQRQVYHLQSRHRYFLVSDIAFGIVNKSAWHLSTIFMFSNKE